jgi:hypothetical protein
VPWCVGVSASEWGPLLLAQPPTVPAVFGSVDHMARAAGCTRADYSCAGLAVRLKAPDLRRLPTQRSRSRIVKQFLPSPTRSLLIGFTPRLPDQLILPADWNLLHLRGRLAHGVGVRGPEA